MTQQEHDRFKRLFRKLCDVCDNAVNVRCKISRSLIVSCAISFAIAACTPETIENTFATAPVGSAVTALAPTPSSDVPEEVPEAAAGDVYREFEEGGQAAPAGSIDLRELPAPSDSGAAADLVELPPPGVPDPLSKAVHLARQDLGARLHSLGLQPEDIEEAELVEAESIVWSDRSLGCPRPNTGYLAEETPGFKIVISAGAESYTYHSDLGQNVVLCLDGEPAPSLE